jgi:hypothetical protein
MFPFGNGWKSTQLSAVVGGGVAIVVSVLVNIKLRL